MLTRDIVRPYLRSVTVAPITSTVRGLSTEVPVGPDNGLDHACVVSCDSIATMSVDRLHRQIGRLLPGQEEELTRAICTAFDLDRP